MLLIASSLYTLGSPSICTSSRAELIEPLLFYQWFLVSAKSKILLVSLLALNVGKKTYLTSAKVLLMHVVWLRNMQLFSPLHHVLCLVNNPILATSQHYTEILIWDKALQVPSIWDNPLNQFAALEVIVISMRHTGIQKHRSYHNYTLLKGVFLKPQRSK